MHFVPDKINRIADQLDALRYRPAMELGDFTYVESGYKTDNTPPEGPWKPFPKDLAFGGKDRHFWFHGAFHTPAARPGCRLYFDLRTALPHFDHRIAGYANEDGWDASKPQGLVYLNGQMVQGLDVNHRQVLLEAGTDYDMYLYFYCGTEEETAYFLPGRKLNELQVFEDFPRQYDNWELSNYYKQKMWVVDQVKSMEPVDEGARRGIRITWTYLSSTLTQTIWLTDRSAQVDFETEIDWHEHHQILKAAFPLDLQTTSAAYEIQFGSLTVRGNQVTLPVHGFELVTLKCRLAARA